MLSQADIHAKLPAKDLKRAQAFYEDVLGLQRIGEGPTGVFYASGDTKVYVYESAAPGTNQATAAGWEVDDIEAEVAELRSRGVAFEEYDLGEIKTVDGIADLKGERAAWFKDSEGNILNIAQVAAD